MIDEKLTDDIAVFLMKDNPTDAEIIGGAELLLRINRNRALHQTIIRRPQRMLSKLTYELNKHLRYRKDGKTLQEVRNLQAEVFAETQEVLDAGEPETEGEADTTAPESEEPATPKKRGKRADHDSLPEDIKNLWDNNAERYKRMKAIFETCKALEQPCDRYEYLLQLKEAYEAYKVDMATYDSYDPNAEAEEPSAEESADATDNAKTIGNARAYITKNREKFEKLSAGDDTDKAAELRLKIQERVNTLITCNAAIDDSTKKWLTDNGFTI